jgi:hypothetical protein
VLGATRVTADQTIFDFRSNFWVNLHHFLYEQASAKTPAASDSPEWQAAVDYYRREVVKHDLLTDEMARINLRLSDLGNASSLQDSGLSAELAAVLKKAAPFYKARWWPEHDRANRAWIEAAKPLIEKYGDVMTKELAEAYQTGWPPHPIRTDVAEYASWAGAYTNLPPTHIIMTSTDTTCYQGSRALEMLFHEASHAMIDRVSNAMDAELKAQNKLFQRRAFWHAVLFYTAGEIAGRHLGNGYSPCAIKYGILERGWAGALPVLEKDWKPYLDGKIDLTTAVRRMVVDYGVPRKPAP